MGGHEGEDNVLRDDDLALFLTINAWGFGAVPMIPSLPRLWWLKPKSDWRAVFEKCRNIQPRKKLTAFFDSATPSLPVHVGRAWWGGRE